MSARISWRQSRNPPSIRSRRSIKRRRRFREAVDHAHGPASVGHRADRGAVSIVYDGTSNHRDLDGELRFGVAVCARRSRRDRIGLSPGAQQGADPSRSFSRSGRRFFLPKARRNQRSLVFPVQSGLKRLGRVFGFGRAFGAQKPAFLAVEHQRGEDRGRERPGVDVNPIWQDFRARDGRVSVHDYLSPRPFVAEEVLPDPKQILRVLAFQRDAGPNARVAEEIIAEARREPGLLHKQAVLGRQARQEIFRARS